MSKIVSQAIRNAQFYKQQALKVTKGKIPQGIKGKYFKNGISRVSFKSQILPHLFLGSGGISTLQLSDGKATSQYEIIGSSDNLERQRNQSFKDLRLFNFLKISKERGSYLSNTSVLPLVNSNVLLTLSQGGIPVKVRKDTLQYIGPDNFQVIKRGFSAHPKIDPENGDIYNICMEPPHTSFRKFTKNMKSVSYQPIKLRSMQSIHDFCLAGDYLVFFQCPVKTNPLSILFNRANLFGNFDSTSSTLLHIHRKSDLSPVKIIQVDPFYTYHFTNGYSNDKQIVLQHCKYQREQAPNLFYFARNAPLISAGKKPMIPFSSVVQQITIDIKNWNISTNVKDIDAQFPICDQRKTGKQWNISYFAERSTKDSALWDMICRFDRKTGKKINTGKNPQCSYGQPAIVQDDAGNQYILTMVTRQEKSYFELYYAENLQLVCQLETPTSIPLGFHGKWEGLC